MEGVPMSCFLFFLKGFSSLRNHPYTLSCIAYFKSCTLPNSQIAASGNPIGLIKNAISNKIRPFCGEYVISTVTPNKATATVFSLIETAKANDLDPFKYLVYIFEKLS